MKEKGWFERWWGTFIIAIFIVSLLIIGSYTNQLYMTVMAIFFILFQYYLGYQGELGRREKMGDPELEITYLPSSTTLVLQARFSFDILNKGDEPAKNLYSTIDYYLRDARIGSESIMPTIGILQPGKKSDPITFAFTYSLNKFDTWVIKIAFICPHYREATYLAKRKYRFNPTHLEHTRAIKKAYGNSDRPGLTPHYNPHIIPSRRLTVNTKRERKWGNRGWKYIKLK